MKITKIVNSSLFCLLFQALSLAQNAHSYQVSFGFGGTKEHYITQVSTRNDGSISTLGARFSFQYVYQFHQGLMFKTGLGLMMCVLA